MKKLAFYLVVGSLLTPSSAFLAQDNAFQVIVNAGNPTTEMEKSRVAKMFIKKVSRWDNDVKVQAIDQTDRTEVRKAFTKGVHGKGVSAIKSYWQRMIFSGRDVPPPEVASDAEVLAYVGEDPGGIGYVSAGVALGDGVKVLRLTE